MGEEEKRVIRLVVTKKLYDRIKKRADEYEDRVTPFIRHLIIDRLNALDLAETSKSMPDVMERMDKFAGEFGNGFQKIFPEVLKMLEVVQVIQERDIEGEKVPRICGTSEE